MRYLGGKSAIAKSIVNRMNVSYRRVWEPFCGGCSVSLELSKLDPELLLCSDYCQPLINMYQNLQNGWRAPTKMTEKEWLRAVSLPDANPLKAFARFGCTFGGDWSGGFVGNANCPEAVTQSSRFLTKLALHEITFQCINFLSGVIPDGISVIYCDPPYQNTAKYNSVASFDHNRFWDTCRAWVSCGVDVYVSEYTAPDDFECIWANLRPSMLANVNNVSNNRMEKLFRKQRTGPLMKLPEPPDTIFAVL